MTVRYLAFRIAESGVKAIFLQERKIKGFDPVKEIGTLIHFDKSPAVHDLIGGQIKP